MLWRPGVKSDGRRPGCTRGRTRESDRGIASRFIAKPNARRCAAVGAAAGAAFVRGTGARCADQDAGTFGGEHR